MNRSTAIKTAAPGTPCQWVDGGCKADQSAIHVLLIDLPIAKAGTALCGYHSPFDAMEGFAGGVQGAATWEIGERCDMTVEVIADEQPDLIALGGNGTGWQLDLMQAQELIDQLQRAIRVARRNSDRM